MSPPPLLIIGASGILAPLTIALAASGTDVLAVGRRRGPLQVLARAGAPEGRVRTLACDASDLDGAARIASHGPFAGAALYGPAVAPASCRVLLRAVAGRAVLVLTSQATDPVHGRSPDGLAARVRPRHGDGVLLLGWDPGSRAWHTPEQVSTATQTVLAGAQDGTLGVVRPWSERPR